MSSKAWRTLGALLVTITAGFRPRRMHSIYLSRDAAGNIVLSDRQVNPAATLRTYAVPRNNSPSNQRGCQRACGALRVIDRRERRGARCANPHLVRAVIQQESAFNPNARSNKGAMGLMQLMPATAAELGVTDPYNPSENIRGGVAYLKGLLVKFQQNVELALAAYNAGPTAVTKYGAVPPYRETKDYVARITKNVDLAPKPKRIFKTIELVDGREVPRYSSVETPGAQLVATAKQ